VWTIWKSLLNLLDSVHLLISPHSPASSQEIKLSGTNGWKLGVSSNPNTHLWVIKKNCKALESKAPLSSFSGSERMRGIPGRDLVESLVVAWERDVGDLWARCISDLRLLHPFVSPPVYEPILTHGVLGKRIMRSWWRPLVTQA